MQKALYRKSITVFKGLTPYQKLTEEEAQQLMELAKTDMPARNRLIEAYLNLSLAICSRIATQWPHKEDEIVSFAIYWLTDTIHRVCAGELMRKHDNLAAYISFTLPRHLRRFCNQDHTIMPSLESNIAKDRIKENSEEWQEQIQGVPLDCLTAIQQNSLQCMADLMELYSQDYIVASGFFSEVEQQYMILKLEGFEDKEIAQKLGKTRSTISVIRTGLRKRLVYLFGGSNGTE